MEWKQLSLFESIEEIEEGQEIYDATICDKCLCNKCIYSVEIYPPLTTEEKELVRAEESCWNCDDCYYYGMDNESLSKNTVKFKCSKFKKADYYTEKERRQADIRAKRRREAFKLIK